MGGPGSIESIHLVPNLVPVIGHRLPGDGLEILAEPVVRISSHSVRFFGIVVCLIGGVAGNRKPQEK